MYIYIDDLCIHCVMTTQFPEIGGTVFSFPPLYSLSLHKQPLRGALRNSYFALVVKNFKNFCECILPFH